MRSLSLLGTLCLTFALGGCTGGPLDVGQGAEPLTACANGTLDYTETDVDCGGGVCGGCAVHKHCTVAADCKSGLCVGGACCGADTADCDGNAANGCEVELTGDNSNCGACGVVCAAGDKCVAGACAAARCVCTPANATGTCASGSCAIASCNAGFADCDLNVGNGCEANVVSDDANCGACGVSCVGGQHCSAGACMAIACGGPLRPLGSACVCAPQCTSGFCVDGVCCNSACTGTCVACDRPGTLGVCTPVSGAPVAGHGSCGANETCSAGTCVAATCVCNPPHGVGTCASGSCAIASCNAGFADCDADPANGCETDVTSDDNNCGACASLCVGGKHCSLALCR